jgi:hypothetical protein
MKNNGRCNAESKYNYHKGSDDLLYDTFFNQCFLLQCCKYIHFLKKLAFLK